MTLAQWRDLSVVLLCLEAFVLSLVPAAILYGLIRGVMWLIGRLRHFAPIVQGYFRTAAEVTAGVSQRVAAPFIAVGATVVAVQRWLRIFSPSPHSQEEV